MQFQKKTRGGSLTSISKIFIKLVLFASLIFILTILVDKIKFPVPSKSIEKKISNENFKIIK